MYASESEHFKNGRNSAYTILQVVLDIAQGYAHIFTLIYEALTYSKDNVNRT